jgi:hypothetical protein
MITVAQAFLLSLAVLAMVVAVLWFRQKKIGRTAFLLWLFLWACFAGVVLFPETAVVAARLLGIKRGTDLALYLSVILIVFLLFRVYVRLETMDQQITQIVRAVALRDAGADRVEDDRGDGAASTREAARTAGRSPRGRSHKP